MGPTLESRSLLRWLAHGKEWRCCRRCRSRHFIATGRLIPTDALNCPTAGRSARYLPNIMYLLKPVALAHPVYSWGQPAAQGWAAAEVAPLPVAAHGYERWAPLQTDFPLDVVS